MHPEEQLETVNNKSKEMESREFEEFEKLVNDGELLNVLSMAIEKFNSK